MAYESAPDNFVETSAQDEVLAVEPVHLPPFEIKGFGSLSPVIFGDDGKVYYDC